MRAAVLGFVLGVGWLQCQAALPNAYSLACLLMPVAILASARARPYLPPAIRLCARFACGATAGALWATLVAQYYLSQQLPKALEGADIELTGTIDSLPLRGDNGIRFNFAVERAADRDGKAIVKIPSKIALGWYDSRPGKGGSIPAGEVRPGERWRLTARLQRPHGNANPYGFDYEVWLLEQGVRATGYVRGDAVRLKTFVPGFGNLVERARMHLRDRIAAALPARPYAGVIVALVIGDQRAVSQADWLLFARTGISHLISISGLHITMIAGLFAAATGYLWRRSFFTRMQLPLLLPAQKAAALAGVASALIYVLLAGFGVPAQRTLYMLIVVALALWLNRIAAISHVLCAALFVVLLFDPWAVLWPGFWLSFGAVAAILFATTGRMVRDRDTLSPWQRRRDDLLAAIHVQYVVTVALVPLTLLLFGQISLVAPLANALAIPVVSLFVAPLALFGAVAPAPVSGWLLTLAHAAMQMLVHVLDVLSAPKLAIWSAPVPDIFLFTLALAGMLWLLMPRGWPLRYLGPFLFVPLLWEEPRHPRTGAVWVTALDVGQGSAVLVETAGRRLLYDTGPAYAPLSDGGNRVIVPYLKARGLAQLDGLIVSHNDSDHSGGALTVMQSVAIKWTLSSLAPGSAIVRAAPGHLPCAAGQHWEWDGVRFEMLHPTLASYDNARLKPNARSCTLKISTSGQSILLAGDIEAPQERELMARLAATPDQLHATILLAPHHGSGTSSTLDFLSAVQPEAAIFQLGYRNRYRHPKAQIWDRYGDLDIKRWRNDEQGAITLQLGQTTTISAYRADHARYWYGR